SFNSTGAILYGALEMGSALGINSIVNSTSRSGGNLNSSSGKLQLLDDSQGEALPTKSL
ncbi:hypothetical protein Tco_0311375, partial [Tanacetum coccineum]